MNVGMYIAMPVCRLVYTRVHGCICVCVCVCTYACMYVRMYPCRHISIKPLCTVCMSSVNIGLLSRERRKVRC